MIGHIHVGATLLLQRQQQGRCYKKGESQVLELLQDSIPDTAEGKHYWHLGCKTGWTFYLTNLKSLLEGGIDLRNKDEQIKNVLNS